MLKSLLRTFYLVSTFAALTFIYGCTPPTIYKAALFDHYLQEHKQMAILPFTVSYDRMKLPKNMTEEMAKESEKAEGLAVQQELFTRLLQREQKGEYTIKFQDLTRTNSILKDSGIPYIMIKDMDRARLCRILGVDAVMSGKITRERPMSDGLAAGIGILVGFWGSTNKVNVSLSVHEYKTSDLVWNYTHEASGSVGSSAKSLAESLMKNVSKHFPYRVPKA